MIKDKANLENFINYYLNGDKKYYLNRLKQDIDMCFENRCEDTHSVAKLFKENNGCYYHLENIFKEVDKEHRLDNLKNYDDFCDKMLNHFIEEYKLLGTGCVVSLTNQFVVDVLKSNICTPRKHYELCYKAFNTICDRQMTKEETRILINRGHYLDDASDEILECAKVVESYLDLLNLITRDTAIEKYCRYLEEHPNYIIDNYSIVRCNLNTLRGKFKDSVVKALNFIDKETKHNLDIDIVKNISRYNVISRHGGDIILVLDKKCTGVYTICGKTYQFMSPKVYLDLQELNLLDFNKYNRIVSKRYE